MVRSSKKNWSDGIEVADGIEGPMAMTRDHNHHNLYVEAGDL